ncbi:hypothetical protein WJ968_21985 [Achromobacter xylosoxidans]
MIAGHARSRGFVLVTNNTREFSLCPGCGWTIGHSDVRSRRRLTAPKAQCQLSLGQNQEQASTVRICRRQGSRPRGG